MAVHSQVHVLQYSHSKSQSHESGVEQKKEKIGEIRPDVVYEYGVCEVLVWVHRTPL